MRSDGIAWVLWILVLFGSLAGCGEDSEEYGEISGTVSFVGTWPSTGDVQVSVWVSWPPAGPPASATEPLPAGDMEQSYRIDGLSKGEYVAVTVGWRDPANPAGAKVLGVYWDQPDSLGVDSQGYVTVQPLAIEINGKLVWSKIDIKANLNIAP